MIKEKFSVLKNFRLSKKTKKIATTAAIVFAVCLFFIWLGAGMYISVPESRRGELWPMFAMYLVFPGLIFYFGAKRVYDILSGEEDPEEEIESEPETEEDDE